MISEIENDLKEIFHSQKKEAKIHYALNQNKINIQLKNLVSLAVLLDTVKLQFTDRGDARYLLK